MGKVTDRSQTIRVVYRHRMFPGQYLCDDYTIGSLEELVLLWNHPGREEGMELIEVKALSGEL